MGVDCYIYPPNELEIHEKGKDPRTVTGAELAGLPKDDSLGFGGESVMHQHFVDCVREDRIPDTDIREIIHTSRLVNEIAQYT